MHPPSLFGTAESLAHQIAAIYLSATMTAKEGPAKVELDPRICEAYVGQFRIYTPKDLIDAIGEVITITYEDDSLFIESKQGKGPIHPESETRFFIEEPIDIRLEFAKEGDRVTELVIDLIGLREIRSTRIESD